MSSVLGRFTSTVRNHPLRSIGCLWIVLAIPLAVNTVEQVDVTAWTSSVRDRLEWGFPLFFNWKFGADLLLLGGGSQGLAGILHALHVNYGRALVVSWKVWILLAALLCAECLRRIARHLGYGRVTGAVAVLLISPGALWVAASHGDISFLAAASVFSSVLLFLRGNWIAGGAVVGLGAGIEYWPLVALALPVILAVGDRGRLKNLVGAFAATVVFTGLNFMGLLVTGSSSLLQHTVTPTTPLLGLRPHPSYPFSLWIFGFSNVPVKAWGALFLVLSAGVLVYGVHRARGLDRHGRGRTGLVVIGCIVVLSVLLDPQSLAQFSVIAMTGMLLMAIALNRNPLVGAVPGIAAVSFFSYQPLSASWNPLSWPFANAAYSPGSSLTLVSVEMHVAALATALTLGWLLLGWVKGDTRRIDLRRLVGPIYGVLVAVAVALAALAAQPSLWTGLGSGSSNPLPQYLTHYAFQAPNAMIAKTTRSGRGTVFEAAFTTTAWKLHREAATRPTESLLLDLVPKLRLREHRIQRDPATGRCFVPFSVIGKYSRPKHVRSLWIDVWVKTYRLSDYSAVELAINGHPYKLTPIGPPINSLQLVAAHVPVAAVSHSSVVRVRLPCTAHGALRRRAAIVPAAGREHIRLNGSRIAVTYLLGPEGTGEFPLSRSLRRIDSFTSPAKLSTPRVYRVGFQWPGAATWLPPVWLMTVSAAGLALALAGAVLLIVRGGRVRAERDTSASEDAST